MVLWLLETEVIEEFEGVESIEELHVWVMSMLLVLELVRLRIEEINGSPLACLEGELVVVPTILSRPKHV